MSTDLKRRGEKRKKKKPPENRFVKAKRACENSSFVSVSSQNDDNEPTSSQNINNSASAEQSQDTATPTSTCSERKLSGITSYIMNLKLVKVKEKQVRQRQY